MGRLNTSLKNGLLKTPVAWVELVAGQGIAGDAHRGFAYRQVSLLMIEDIEAQRARLGLSSRIPLGPGAYAKSLTTRGVDPSALCIGNIEYHREDDFC